LLISLLYTTQKRITKERITKERIIKGSNIVHPSDERCAGKSSALLTRREFASRDMFDLEFFLRENWPINQ
jgi:hypothetical protein